MDTYILKQGRKTVYKYINETKRIEPIEFILRPGINYRYTLNGKNIFMGNFDFPIHIVLKGREVGFLAKTI